MGTTDKLVIPDQLQPSMNKREKIYSTETNTNFMARYNFASNKTVSTLLGFQSKIIFE